MRSLRKIKFPPTKSTIFNQHETSPYIYAVRSGAVKTTISLSDKREQITGFFLPGDNIESNIYNNNAYAIQKTSICSISTENLKTISSQVDGLQEYFLQLAAKQIQDDQKKCYYSTNSMHPSELQCFFYH